MRVRRTFWADKFQVNSEHVLWQRVSALLRWERKTSAELLSFLSKEIQSEALGLRARICSEAPLAKTWHRDSDLDVAVICPRAKAKQAKRTLENLGELTVDRYGNRVSGVVGTRSIVELAKPGQSGYGEGGEVALSAPESPRGADRADGGSGLCWWPPGAGAGVMRADVRGGLLRVRVTPAADPLG